MPLGEYPDPNPEELRSSVRVFNEGAMRGIAGKPGSDYWDWEHIDAVCQPINSHP